MFDRISLKNWLKLKEVKTIERVVIVGYSFVEVEPHGLHWPPWSQYTYSSIFPVRESEVSCFMSPNDMFKNIVSLSLLNDHTQWPRPFVVKKNSHTPLINTPAHIERYYKLLAKPLSCRYYLNSNSNNIYCSIW